MEYADILRKAATNPDELNDSEIATLRRACREYPADAVAPALLLKYADSVLDDEERKYARARVQLYCGRPSILIKAIDPAGKGFNEFYPPLPSENRPSTTSAIDVFLERYGHRSSKEDELLERMIFNPVPDYAEQLARQSHTECETSSRPLNDVDGKNDSAQDNLIDAFIASHPVADGNELSVPKTSPETPVQPVRKKSVKGTPTSSLLSQSLAKIFIKQGRYERAYEIISNLSLNYPEKSVYFADQLRFLRKLIINSRKGTKN